MMKRSGLATMALMTAALGFGHFDSSLPQDAFGTPSRKKRKHRRNSKQKAKACRLRLKKRRAKNKMAKQSRKGNRE